MNNEILLPFRCNERLLSSKSPVITGLFRPLRSFPFYCSRGFIRDIEDYAVDVWGLGNDSGAYPPEQGIGQLCELDGHCVGGDDGADADDVIIGTLIAHDADGLHTGKDGEVLPDGTVKTGFCYLIAEDVIGLTEYVKLFFGDIAEDTDGKTGAGEGLPPDEGGGHAEAFAEAANLVLKELL